MAFVEVTVESDSLCAMPKVRQLLQDCARRAGVTAISVDVLGAFVLAGPRRCRFRMRFEISEELESIFAALLFKIGCDGSTI